MKLRNRILACLLASAAAFAGLASAVTNAQTGSAPASAKGKGNLATFVVYRNAAGETACRVATPEERRRIMEARPGDGLHLIYRGAPRRRTEAGVVEDYSTGADFSTGASSSGGTYAATAGPLPALLPSAGLHIFLHGTSQLESNQAAKNAFIVAANRWEALVSTPINVVIDVDYGTQFFGEAYPDANILGQTGSRSVSTAFSNVRQRLINNSPTSSELSLYNALPASTVPVETDAGAGSTVSSAILTRANARAIGLVPNIANPDSVATGSADAQIGFNSAWPFDFTPDDNNGVIDSGKTDFDAVVTHEIGHALGFISDSADSATPTALTVWDVFRFRPGAASLSSMATAQRVMTAGGNQVFFDAQPHLVSGTQTQELGLSTGGPDGDATGGDGNQSSHWKDDRLVAGRPYIGIMDPTIGSGVRREITANDTNALDAFGYSIGGAVGPPPPPPAAPPNDNFANAVTLQGASGTVTGTNVSATKQAGEPNHAQNAGGSSVWYFWTAPVSGLVTFDTVGSSYDTTLAAYTGSAVNSLALLNENDDIVLGQNIQSRITFGANAGVTYRIAVDGFDGDTGAVVLNWSGPAAPAAGFKIGGRILDPDGSPLAGVRVFIDGPPMTNSFPALPPTTNADGVYQFALLSPGGNYTVHPEDSRYTFGPVTAAFSAISSDKTNVNFTATSAPASLAGTVSEAGQPLQGVSVGLLGFGPTRLLKQTTTDAAGRWTFNGLTVGQSYDVVLLKTGYSFATPSLTVPLSTAATDAGNVQAARANPVDASEFFVAQHYRDFLGREPDASGLAFWTNEIESCGFDLQCRQLKRIHVSAAFFLAIEFQETGYLVERMYKVAYGDATEVSTGLVVPVIRRQEFLDDTPLIRGTVVVGQGAWQAQLEANKTAYALAFVQRQRFADAFPASLTPAQFVAKLNQNAGGLLPQARVDEIAAEMVSNIASAGVPAARAVALRRVAESGELDGVEKSRAFVLMQYYGYLRRNPNDAPERDLNYAGWNFWLGKLDDNGGDPVRAEMVKAFLDATEYRNRFAQQ